MSAQEVTAGEVSVPTSLFHDRSFRRFWAGQAASALGDAFSFVALPLLVLEATGSVVAMGIVTATFAITQVAAGLFSGTIADRIDRRRMMIVCDLVRFVAYSAIPAMWILRGPSLVLLIGVTAVGSAAGNLFSVGYVTGVAGMVRRDRLTEANGYLQGSQSLTYVVGPMLAGVVASRFGAALAIGVDALSYAVSAFCLWRVRFTPVSTEEANLNRSLLAGPQFLLRHPTLRAVTATIVLAMVLSSTEGTIDVIIFHLHHSLAQTDSTVGVTLGLSAVGAVAGAVFVSRLQRRFGFGACFLFSTAAQAVALMAMGFSKGAVLIAAAGVIWSGGLTARAVVTSALFQAVAPNEILGRVTAGFGVVVIAATSLGSVLITVAAQRWGTTTTFLVSGTCLGVVAVLASFSAVLKGEPHASEYRN